MELDRFAENALEYGLRNLIRNAGNTQHPDEFLLRAAFEGIDTTTEQLLYVVNNKSRYDFNIIVLFQKCSKCYISGFDDTTYGYSSKVKAINNYARIILQPEESEKYTYDKHELSFEKIDTTDCITDGERQRLYNLIIECLWRNGIYIKIVEWLDRLDMKRALLESPSFIDDL